MRNEPDAYGRGERRPSWAALTSIGDGTWVAMVGDGQGGIRHLEFMAGAAPEIDPTPADAALLRMDVHRAADWHFDGAEWRTQVRL